MHVKKMIRGTGMFVILLCGVVKADVRTTVNENGDTLKPYVDPTIKGRLPSKVLSYEYDFITPTKIKSFSDVSEIGSGQAAISNVKKITMKAKFPLWSSEGLKMFMGVSYCRSEVCFDNGGYKDFSLYQSLNEKELRSIGISHYVLKPFRGKTFFIMKTGVSLVGDYFLEESKNRDYMKISVSPVLGFKKDEYTSFGFGLSYSNSFGRTSIYPVFDFNKTFNENWGIEVVAPARALVRYKASESLFLRTGIEMEQSSHNLRMDYNPLSVYDQLILKNTGMRFQVSMDRQLAGPFWLSVSTGLSKNLRYNVYGTGDDSNREIVGSKVGSSVFFLSTIYLTSPMKYLRLSRMIR